MFRSGRQSRSSIIVASPGIDASSFAMPKSSTFTWPLGVIITFAGLQIAMDHSMFVRFFQSLRNLGEQSPWRPLH